MATPASGRLDVHHHVIPPVFERFAGTSTPWSAASTLSWMDDHRVTAAVMSVSAPGLPSTADGGGPRLAREVNEFTAELVKNHPDRFGHFASLPMADHDPASVLEEVGYAFDTLQADGVVLLSNAAWHIPRRPAMGTGLGRTRSSPGRGLHPPHGHRTPTPPRP